MYAIPCKEETEETDSIYGELNGVVGVHGFFRISDMLSNGWKGIVSWFQFIMYTLRKAIQIDSSNITAMRAIRGAIGVFIPLTLGVITKHTQVGVSIAGGAAMLGSVSLADTH